MKIFIFVTVTIASLVSLACSGGTTTPAANTATANKAPANSTVPNNATAPAKADDIVEHHRLAQIETIVT